MKTVFLSSTSKDLEAYRKAAIDVCMRLGLHPIAMEYFNAQPVGATAGSKRELDKADLYVGFFAHRYGYIEDGQTNSVTEIEFDYAGERGLDRICFIVDPTIPWPPEHTDHANNPKLVAFKDKVNKLIRGQFTSVDKFEALLTASLVEWSGGLQARTTTASSAIVAKRADHLREKPRVFIGRENLINQAYPLLETHQQVLLQGFGGMGKTALAAELAAKWITDGKGVVLWLKAGSAEADALFEALARPFNQHQAIASQTGEAKITAVNDFLYSCGASLLVLDDCWNSRALFTLLEAVPAEIPVLMTARQRYPIEGDIIPVEKLSDDDALALLNQHAGNRNMTPSSPAGRVGEGLDLCHLLGNHAFAVEIAGKTLKAQTWTPAELIAQIKDAPDKLTMPLELAETGRENVAKLLEVSLNALDEQTRNVFLAFGAFFAPQLTAEMVTRYFIGTPEVTDQQLTAVRQQIPDLKELSDDELRSQLAKYIVDNADSSSITNALDTLHLHGLVERLPVTDNSIAAYRIHDLAYSYAHAQAIDEAHQRALQACLSYTEHYKKPSLPNFAALHPELNNLLGTADWAFEHQHYAAVERFAWGLYMGSDMGGFLYYQGFYGESTRLLLLAAQAAEHLGSKRDQSSHLGNLGTTYRNLGQVEHAINYYQQALSIAHETGDKHGESNRLGNLGNAYSDLRQTEQAIDYYQQALAIAHEIGDRRNEGNWLGNLGNAYSDLGQQEQAIDYHQQALAIVREIGDKRSQGSILGNLGVAYRKLEQVEQAIDYYQQALAISREIGDRMNQANQLHNIGAIYADRKNYPLALQHFQQARAIFAEIGAQHLVKIVDDNIANTQAKMNADPNSPT